MQSGRPEAPSAHAEPTNPDPRDPLVGRVIAGRYEVVALVARGGMGRIYRAIQQPLGREVALKVLGGALDQGGDDDFAQRFLLEAATLARLQHPNTVTLFDYGVTDRGHLAYMVMELVNGRNLARILRQEGRLNPAQALWIAHEVARSLAEAHSLGIVHRDLKPSNVMLSRGAEGQQVKVLDFGIVKLMQEGAQDLTQGDQLIGSPRYMSPEQIQGGGVDGRSDLYSLGILLTEMITGTVPFGGENSVEILFGHLQRPVPTLGELAGKPVPEVVEALVARCLQKSASKRFPDAAAFRLAARAALAQVDPGGAFLLPDATLGAAGHPVPTPNLADATPGSADRTLALPHRTGQQTRAFTFLPWLVGGAGLALLFSAITVTALLILWPSFAPSPQLAAPEIVPMAPVPAPIVLVQIQSEPPGAELREGERLLGHTPMDLPLPEEGSQTLVLMADGHEPGTLTLTAGEAATPRMITLQPLPKAPTPAPPATAPAHPRAEPASPDLDIRVSR